MNTHLSLPLLVLGLGWLTGAQTQEVLKLWAGQPRPHYKDNTLIEREIGAWGTVCATNVTDPTLTLYPARGKNAGIGVVVIPGGNYAVVAIRHEGHDVARALSERGVTAAVLKYRLPDPESSDQPETVPLADARRALKLLRQQTARLGVDPLKVGVLGFSAGSHLATVACLWKSTDAEENPAFAGLIYGVTNHSQDNIRWLEETLYFRKLTPEELARNRLLDLVDRSTPPAFLVHAYDDETCKVEETTLYAQRLFEHKVPVEMHLFQKGGHGFGLGNKADGTDLWLSLFVTWLQRL
jgi:acetyl esterase/lipase